MSAPEPPVPLRPLELRRGTKAVTELFADGRRIAIRVKFSITTVSSATSNAGSDVGTAQVYQELI